MVARLFRLRVALAAAVFRGGVRAVARRTVCAVAAGCTAIGYAWAPGQLADSAAEQRALDICFATLLLAGAAFVPFFAGITNLEPRQFATVWSGAARIATAMYVSTLCTWSAGWLLLWLLALKVFRPEWAGNSFTFAAAALGTLLLAFAWVRVGSGLVRLIASRRALLVVRLAGLMLLCTALPLIALMLAEAVRAPRSSVVSAAAEFFGWTPFGAPLAGFLFAAQGDGQAMLARFAVAGVSLGLLLLCWYLIVWQSVSKVERPAHFHISGENLALFERLPATPASVIGGRALSYWRRDPRYWVTLLAIPFAPAIMLLALHTAGVSIQLLAFLPLPVISLLLGWSAHNDVSLDSTAIWLHVASGTKGWHDRLGRMAPVLLIGVPVAVVGSSVTVAVNGQWQLLPAVVGLNLAILCVSAGSASVFSALLPYPASRPGESPFVQPAGNGAGSGLAQTLAMVTAVAGSIPVVAVFLMVTQHATPTLQLNLLACAACTLWGLLLLGLFVFCGGKIFDRNAPELVALTQTFD